MEGFEFDVGVLALCGAWEERQVDELAALTHLENILCWTSLSMENSVIASTNQDLIKFSHEVLDELQSLDLSEQMVSPFCKLFSLMSKFPFPPLPTLSHSITLYPFPSPTLSHSIPSLVPLYPFPSLTVGLTVALWITVGLIPLSYAC
jgi:hypothetical protein